MIQLDFYACLIAIHLGSNLHKKHVTFAYVILSFMIGELFCSLIEDLAMLFCFIEPPRRQKHNFIAFCRFQLVNKVTHLLVIYPLTDPIDNNTVKPTTTPTTGES